MSQQTIQIADKPTLDDVKALLENSGYGLEALKNSLGSGGGGGNGGGVACQFSIKENSVVVNQDEVVSTLPYSFQYGSAVVLNDEIHILGGSDSGTSKKHYKWDGTSWTSASKLPPYNFYFGSAVVLNNEIHILGGSDSYGIKSHYKWDGTSWTSVSKLPYNFSNGSAVVLNNEIHILGSDNSYSTNNYVSHYKWNGSSWTSVSKLPYNFSNSSAVVLNDEIHILGGYNSSHYTSHYKWDGTSWTSVSTLPYNFYHGSAVVLNDKIHILGSIDSDTKHYKIKRSAHLITLYLQSGNKIICDTKKTGPISDNFKKVDFGYECTKTGLCKMYDIGSTNNIIFTII